MTNDTSDHSIGINELGKDEIFLLILLILHTVLVLFNALRLPINECMRYCKKIKDKVKGRYEQ